MVPDRSTFMQIKYPDLQFDWSKYQFPDWSESWILMGHYGTAVVGKDANEENSGAPLIGWGKSQPIGQNTISGNSLWGLAQSSGTELGGLGSPVYDFSQKCRVCVRPW